MGAFKIFYFRDGCSQACGTQGDPGWVLGSGMGAFEIPSIRDGRSQVCSYGFPWRALVKTRIDHPQGSREGQPPPLCEHPASLKHWSCFQLEIPPGKQLEGACARTAGQGGLSGDAVGISK